MGLLTDMIPNSWNSHNENHSADSKENYQWDIWSEKVKMGDFILLQLLKYT